MLDVGTNNEELLNDPSMSACAGANYRDGEYDDFVEEFVSAATSVFPSSLVIRTRGFCQPHRRFAFCANIATNLRLLTIPGNGSGGARGHLLGTAGETASSLTRNCFSSAPARRRRALRTLWFRQWLLRAVAAELERPTVPSGLHGTFHKVLGASPYGGNFFTAIRSLEATVIIGVAAARGIFTPEVLQTMAEINERPIVFGFQSNLEVGMHRRRGISPHKRARAVRLRRPLRPGEAGREDFRAGSGEQLVHPGGRTRCYRERHATHNDEMFMSAALTLARLVTEADLARAA